MARLIDANAFIEKHCAECNYFQANGICREDAPLCASARIVTDLPTIDAVQVVRCKNCSYWSKAKVNKQGFLICPASGMEIMANDFCSYGERKDNA